MTLWQLALAIFGSLVLYCLVLPALGSFLMHRMLAWAGTPQPLDLCVKVAFASTYAAFFCIQAVGRYFLPDPSVFEGRLIWMGVMLGIQLVLVVVLMRNYTPRALAAEIAAIVLASVLTFGTHFLFSPVRSTSAIDKEEHSQRGMPWQPIQAAAARAARQPPA
jgi:hypothetical protein